jgi:hypothetical protein
VSTGTTANLYSFGVSGGDSGNGAVTMLVGSANGVIKSLDTGKTWSALSLVSPAPLYGMQLNGTTAFAVGGSGTLLKSTNTGTSWSTMSSGVTQQLNGVVFFDSNNVISPTGYIAGAGGLILKTTNTGATWVAQTSGTTQSLNAITPTHGDNNPVVYVYAVGNGGVILKGNVSTTPILSAPEHTATHPRLAGTGMTRELFSVDSPYGLLWMDASGRLMFKTMNH